MVEQIGIWESGIRYGPKGTQIGKVKRGIATKVATKDTQKIDN